jgi:hypothetical protein
MIKNNTIGVYIKLNHNKEIIDINSDVFILDFSNWIKIDEGYGDKYAHAQNNYFPKRIVNEKGIYNYKYLNGRIYEV